MNDTHPSIKKASLVLGKNIVLRNAGAQDADFILGLRTDEDKSKYLSSTSPDRYKQIAWLDIYKNKNDQAYFIIEDRKGERLGTVRLYDAVNDSFCWGSWIIKTGAPASTAVESALLVYVYALDRLGFNRSHFDVRKGNEHVWSFHERFGAVRVGETCEDFLYEISGDSIRSSIKRFKKFLPEEVMVEAIK